MKAANRPVRAMMERGDRDGSGGDDSGKPADNTFPGNPGQVQHIFRDSPGHLPGPWQIENSFERSQATIQLRSAKTSLATHGRRKHPERHAGVDRNPERSNHKRRLESNAAII